MLSAALVSLTLLQAAAPQALTVGLGHRSGAVASIPEASGPVLDERSAAKANAPIPLRFGQTDAWGCLRAASNPSYCRHEAVLTIGSVPMAASAAVLVSCPTLGGCWDGSVYVPLRSNWFGDPMLSDYEREVLRSAGAVRGRELAAEKRRLQDQIRARDAATRSATGSIGPRYDAPASSRGISSPPQATRPNYPSASTSGGKPSAVPSRGRDQ